MQATPRLRPGLSVRLLPGRPNMPELQGYPLHPFRLQEAHVGVAVMLAFIGQKLLVGHRRQFLASHFTRRYPPSEISPHIHSAGSVAVLVNVETTPVQLHAILFPSGDPARRGISSYLRARWVFMTFCESHASQVPFHAVWHMPAAGWSANRDIAAAR